MAQFMVVNDVCISKAHKRHFILLNIYLTFLDIVELFSFSVFVLKDRLKDTTELSKN